MPLKVQKKFMITFTSCVLSLKPNKYVESVSSSLKHLTVLKDWLVNEILTLLHKNIT